MSGSTRESGRPWLRAQHPSQVPDSPNSSFLMPDSQPQSLLHSCRNMESGAVLCLWRWMASDPPLLATQRQGSREHGALGDHTPQNHWQRVKTTRAFLQTAPSKLQRPLRHKKWRNSFPTGHRKATKRSIGTKPCEAEQASGRALPHGLLLLWD